MRPGGLTALAAFNFIFGSLALLIHLIGLATVSNMRRATEASGRSVSESFLLLQHAVGLVVAALLIVSGVGYLRRKRVSGYLLGNIEAVLAILALAHVVGWGPDSLSPVTLINLSYAAITLFLLNVIFRKDFH